MKKLLDERDVLAFHVLTQLHSEYNLRMASPSALREKCVEAYTFAPAMLDARDNLMPKA